MSGPVSQKPVKVDVVVQDYMDSLLADLFPDIQDEIEPPQPVAIVDLLDATEVEITAQNAQAALKEQDEPTAPCTPTPAPSSTLSDAPQPLEQPQAITELASAPIEPVIAQVAEITLPIEVRTEAPEVINPETTVATESIEERAYPNAPVWAQQAFDVLLFDVCGLKLAVCMESLGRIIKVEQELNQLIGRPAWFMGAYSENEQSLYVVDTAKFIMPEKGYDLAEQGFEFIIQLQRSNWSLACKEVYSTVRLLPDQVKWRSSEGKRPWLAGTVIEHMCALIHVDSLVELLESENT